MQKIVPFMMLGVTLWVSEVFAVPACPEPFEVTQSDGIKVLLHKRGDEFLSWHEDTDGYTVIRDEKSKDWFYAELSADASKLVPSAMRVGASAKARPSVRRILPQRAVESAHAKNLLAMPTQTAATEERTLKTTGIVKQLVALVEFSDQPFVHTSSQFDALFNEAGYSADGNKGSVYDYYREVSYGKLTVQSTVVGPIKLSKTHAYYGNNASRTQRMTEFGKDVLKALDDAGINFKEYDLDNDGWMDELDVIHAGWAEEFGNNSDDWIWSARWSYGEGGYFAQYDGVKIASYHTEPELRGADSVAANLCKITQVGVICHEFGHSLGLPDLYDIDKDIGKTSEGVGNFCLMGGGSWGYITGDDQGTCPVPMSAWSKKRLGWVVPTEITTAGHYSLPRAEDNAKVYMLKGDLPGKEYFLLENKTATGFGRGLPGTNKGMLIWHVDDAKTDNTDENHYWVDLEEASGTQHLENDVNRGDDSDYFRATTMPSFTASTSPNNKSYSGTPLGMSITSISAPGATMTFDVSGGEVVAAPTITGYGGYTTYTYIEWNAVSGATGYRIYRSTSASSRPSTAYATVSSSSTVYRDSNGAPGVIYYYWLSAVGPTGESVSGPISTYRRAYFNTLSPTSLSFDGPGGVLSVSVGANTSWQATKPTTATWLTLAKTETDGNGTLTVTATANTSSSARGATITLTAAPGTAYPVTRTISVSQSVASAISLTSALDNTALTFTTGGSANWFGQKDMTHDGADAARSGKIGNSAISWMETTVTGPGIISFWWRVSSEQGWDYLELLVDGTVKKSISGLNDTWARVSQLIEESGTRTIQWRYRKDVSNAHGLDAGFVDQVEWTDNVVTDVDDLGIGFVSGGGIYALTLKNGRQVAFYDSWLTDAGISTSGGITASLLNAMGRNGLPRYQSYLFGLEPESAIPAEEQLQPTIAFDANGTPIISCIPKMDNDLVRYTTLGKPSLNAADWVEVTPGNKASMKFFKVKVELAK